MLICFVNHKTRSKIKIGDNDGKENNKKRNIHGGKKYYYQLNKDL